MANFEPEIIRDRDLPPRPLKSPLQSEKLPQQEPAPTSSTVEIQSFSNETAMDRKLLREFVGFHWKHYEGDSQYVPLLDYEYLGSKLLGMCGFFESRNSFFKYGECRFFLARQNGKIVGRCNAFVNHRHNQHWKDKVGFFGQFEAIDDQAVVNSLVQAAAAWLKSRGMEIMRGPQNFPVNEATPGILVEGFKTRPVIYYHYNKPYYQKLIERAGLKAVKSVMSWETHVDHSGRKDRLKKVGEKLIEKTGIRFETWDEKPLKVRIQQMFEIYNEAWSENFGFVPFLFEEFERIIKDMQLIVDKKLLSFIYLNNECVGFFGAIPNIFEVLKPNPWNQKFELLRAIKMLLFKSKIRGVRLGYLGVKKAYRGLGLDVVTLYKQQEMVEKRGYEYCDIGWVLEDNHKVISILNKFETPVSKRYVIYDKSLI